MSETGTVKTIHSCTLNGQTVTSEGCETFEEYLKKIADLAERFWADALAKKEQEKTSETRVKWKSEICGEGAFIDVLRDNVLTKVAVFCRNAKGHKTQHWATIEGVRVNWE